MAATATVNFNLIFEDDTTKTLSFGPINPSAVSLNYLKAYVQQFEYTFTSDTAKLMTSKYGNDWAGFESVKIVTTDKKIIF